MGTLRLTLTPSGRAALADGRTLWQAVAAGLVGPEHSALAVAWEVVLAVLAPGDVIGEEDVRVLVQAVIPESGWRVAGRRAPSESDTSALFFAVLIAGPGTDPGNGGGSGGGSGGDDPTLPVTGPVAGQAAGVGAALVGLGALLLFAARRRRAEGVE